jgi:energy-coupling factor transporter ATP-binding protein EcfA2
MDLLSNHAPGDTATALPGALETGPMLAPQARSVRDTGLEPQLVTGLVVKALHMLGKTSVPALSSRLKLSSSVLRELLDQLIAERQVDVAWAGDTDLDAQYQLNALGRRAAADYLAQSRYIGPAPIPLAAYCSMVERQSLRQPHAARFTGADVSAVLSEDGHDPSVLDQVGAALHARRTLLLYGPSGSGKTTLARKLGQLFQDTVLVPYAVVVDGHIILVHDPLVHRAPPPLPRLVGQRHTVDARWALCLRPLVHVGTNLSREMLELRIDPATGTFRAPLHLQANNGMLVVDDVGRQRLPVGEMLDRLTGPLDHGVDQLALPGGQAEIVPFDVSVVFATNLAPDTVFDDAAKRRIGYKVAVGALSVDAYRELVRRQCRLRGIGIDEAALDHLLMRLHGGSGRPLLAAYAYELLGRIIDFASYTGTAARLSSAALEQAWRSMFAGSARAPSGSSIHSRDQS